MLRKIESLEPSHNNCIYLYKCARCARVYYMDAVSRYGIGRSEEDMRVSAASFNIAYTHIVLNIIYLNVHRHIAFTCIYIHIYKVYIVRNG